MGCCSSSPILDDTSIIAHLNVDRLAVMRVFSSSISPRHGLLYIKGQFLHYEVTSGQDSTNRASFSWLYGVNFRIAINNIKTIEIVEEKEVIPFPEHPQYNATVPYGAVFDAPFIKITTNLKQTIYAGSSHDIRGFTNTLQSMSNTTGTQFT